MMCEQPAQQAAAQQLLTSIHARGKVNSAITYAVRKQHTFIHGRGWGSISSAGMPNAVSLWVVGLRPASWLSSVAPPVREA